MAEGEIIRRLTAILGAGVVLLAPFSAFSYHQTLGQESSFAGDTLFEVVIPIAIVVVAAMIGLGFWGRKKPKSKTKRRKRKSSR